MATLKNRRRERFAIEIAGMTPLAKAYAEAGFKASPWAPYNASKLMHDPAVAARIDELRDAIGDRAKIHAEYIQRKLLPLVEANPQDLFEAASNGAGQRCDALRQITELPRELAAAIQKIKCDPKTGAVTEISLYDKTAAGNVLLRSVGAMSDNVSENPITIERIERVIIEPQNNPPNHGFRPGLAALAGRLMIPSGIDDHDKSK
jgi:hypothetical protein